MASRADAICLRLAGGPQSARQLALALGVSQPSVSRALAELGERIVRTGAARSIQYALRDTIRGLPDVPVYRVDAEGRIQQIGTLLPVRADGFVMLQADGVALHSDGLPWWLFDMRPQGYLGRAFAARYGAGLGLPQRLADWTDTHALRALLESLPLGHDLTGNLLLGDAARDQFLAAPLATPVAQDDKATEYPRLALEAAQGDLPGSSAGGEQPKFSTCAMTPGGLRHMIVKFSEAEASPVSERWRDLLLAEHIALGVLRGANVAGVAAATTQIFDSEHQRFLEVERFDRVGPLGRRALFSLAALDAEFAGMGTGGWPTMVRRLAADGHVRPQAVAGVDLLWAYGSLIGNTDMHTGNLSFMSEQGRPYALAPAYDMSPMAFAPRSSGGLPDALPEASIHASVGNAIWRQAQALARGFVARIAADARFSQRFGPCIAALERHIQIAGTRIERLG